MYTRETLERIALLLSKQLQNSLSASEQQELEEWINQSPETAAACKEMISPAYLRDGVKALQQVKQEIDRGLMLNGVPVKEIAPLRRMHIIRRWSAVAAIFLLVIGAGVYYFNTQSFKSKKSPQITVQTNDILPGNNRAVLTINGNQNIDLSSGKKGININNTITYNDGEKIADAGQWLQLTTPRGGQYQAVLPDGSKVWLNAASSIKFPSQFNGKERSVEVTGEAYFEIAKDAAKPFKVMGGEQEIEVLGTSFNINIYNEEPIKKTTLITGSIKITNNNQTAILKPGQQANISILSILPIRLIPVQTNDVIAWKNGLFYFNASDIQTVLREISRWYDLDIIYTSKPAPRKITGEIQRNLSLAQVMATLGDLDIHYQLEGRKLIISATK